MNKTTINPFVTGFAGVRRRAGVAFGIGLLALSGLLAGCGGGATTEANPDLGGGATGYSGPAAQNQSVLNFQAELWPHLKDNCGNCHAPDTAAKQEPYFARNDDVNQAYNAAITVADLNNPAASRLVIRVGNGHNCWLATDSQCATMMTNWIANWANGGAGGSGGSGGGLVLSAPTYREPGGSRAFPADSSAFASTVYPLLQQHCSACHSETAPASTRQSPFFGSPNVDTAYAEVKPKIDLGDGDIPPSTPISDKVATSRLVVRLRDEFHNCWSTCDADALEMRNAIIAFASGIQATGLDPANLTVSGALTLSEGLLDSGSGRDESNVIARWEFKEGSGRDVMDLSGVGTPVNLTLSGRYEWVGGNGVRFLGGHAQSLGNAGKLYDMITAAAGGTGIDQYSIEAWVIPENVTQEQAYLLSYSSGDAARNMGLGQHTTYYEVLNRSNTTDGTRASALSTMDAADPDLQDAVKPNLQHVVVNFSSAGREIYVDGQLVHADNTTGESLSGWSRDYLLTLGDEAAGMHPWQGVMRFLAIRNRVMTPAQITKNFDAGIAEKRYLLFSVGNLDGVPDNSFILMEVSQLDDYAYRFYRPVFINLDGNWTPAAGIPIKGLRLGINGHLAPLGQAYAYLDTTVDSANYTAGAGQVLSDIGTIIPVENGPDQDEFFLAFETIGNVGTAYVENDPPAPARPEPAPVSAIGLRTFEEIDESMSQLTGVPRATVASVYDTYRQQLPSVETIEAFVTSHQMAVTQLALAYCDALVNDASLRSAFFGGFGFNAALPAEGSRQGIIDPLLTKMLNVAGNVEVTSQPPATNVGGELDSLMSKMCGTDSSTCTTGARTREAATAACATMLGSATLLVQ